ncbi:hypothetical protein HDU77_008428 [Chytriomyces hyalinus]|nr:hypothetical protein HDU77_008428 [Chytriomyces hyalinus]KAJ3399415.1 hypothetical protein HDU80_007906 [Chytriomyces hyalinus]
MAPQITLYTVGTPNGQKVSIALDELKIDHKVHQIQFSTNEQKEEWFLKINPNGRIPAIVDHSRGDFAVFESGAILLYLAEHHDPDHILLPEDPNQKSEAIQWLMWQMGGLGPMQGQANHFFRYAPEKIPYGIKRYQDETKRLYSVMERRFADGREFLAGPYSVADIACFTWTAVNQWALGPDFSISDYPLVEKWLHRVAERPAVVSGMKPSTIIQDGFRSKITAAEAEARAQEAAKWILAEKEKNAEEKL